MARRRSDRRPRGRVPAVLGAVLVLAVVAVGARPTAAEWTDRAHAEGELQAGWWAQAAARAQLVEVDALTLDTLDAVTTAAEYPRSPGPHTAAVDADVLGRLLGLRLPGIGLPLIGDGTEPGLLDLGPAAGLGLLNGYAATADRTTARAASGTVTDDGAVDLSPVADPADTDLARLSLTALLADLEVDGLTDRLVDDVSLGLGALGTTARWTAGGDPEAEYVLAGAELRLHSPTVAGLVDELRQAVADLDGALDTTLGPTGPLQQLLDGLSTTPLDLGLVSVDLGRPQLHASVELDALLDGLLAGPLTSEDGLVSVDLTSGSVGVDLRSLVAGGDLNDLPPDTQLLTADNIGRIARAVTDLLDSLVTGAAAGVTATLEETHLLLRIPAAVEALFGILPVAHVTVLADIGVGELLSGGRLSLDVEGSLLGIISLDALVALLLDPLTDLLVPLLTVALGELLDDVPTLVGDTVGAAVGAVTGTLGPVLEPLLTQLVSITVNSQEVTGPAGEETFTVRALAVELLPVLGSGSVTVGLASSSVRVWQSAEPPPG